MPSLLLAVAATRPRRASESHEDLMVEDSAGVVSENLHGKAELKRHLLDVGHPGLFGLVQVWWVSYRIPTIWQFP